MVDFFSALLDPQIPFVRYALFAGLLASVSFGITGTFVVVRRISSIAGAISHSVLGGIGIAMYASITFGWSWLDPMIGAIAAALISAVLIGVISFYGREREDTVIGAIWAIGMAIGLLFIAKTAGYQDPMSYLFGNILLISKTDIYLIFGLAVLITVLSFLFYNKLLAVSFDEEFASLRGVRVKFFYLILLGLTALTVVLMIRVVGIVMVIAFLTLPAATAGYYSKLLWHMMALAIVFSMVFNVLGLAISYRYDLPTGPTIIMVAGLGYILTTIGSALVRQRRRSRV